MTTPAISVRNLSKCYKLGTIGRHTLVDECQYLWHKLRGKDPRAHFSKIGHTATEARRVEAEQEGNQKFWALRDVSFDVQPGEVVGIIGRNGAGKSTLLKLLTRITEPTSGEVVINGRVASLLEVGTGFHPELTGRENVYMNGAILGMKKKEIQAQFDRIVAFSEIEKFMDTPVKRYSSGMYVRLAFAVAAHLDPEILLVDEVLAVGDASFQKKCLGKMGDVAKTGRTVFFVSHNMMAINHLCQRSLLIDHGTLALDDEASSVVKVYMKSSASRTMNRDLTGLTLDRTGSGFARLESAALLTLSGEPFSALQMGDGLRIRVGIRAKGNASDISIGISIYNLHGFRICGFQSATTSGKTLVLEEGQLTSVDCIIPEMNLISGSYTVNINLIRMAGTREMTDMVRHALAFEVIPRDVYGTGQLPTGDAVYFPVLWEQEGNRLL